ncbi:MAG: hypothetical protein C0490_09120 [Marivirga sp.]|nr:hypothetical protein [Marivirga sp.]
MLFAFANLVIGIMAGLIRIGWSFPTNSVSMHHGAIMVGGFLGTLILLEKVIPLKKKILFALPVINALSLVMIVPRFYLIGQIFLMIGAVGLLIVFLLYFRQQPEDLSTMLMITGACCQIIGHVMLIAKEFYPIAFPWWMGFILFVIVGERVELSKFLPVTRQNKYLLIGFLVLFLIGLVVPFHGTGKYLSGLGLITIAIWLLKHDVIAIAIKKEGLARFSAAALMSGCLSLMFTGVFMISLPDLPFAYDAIVHTFFLGFVFPMIFGHGPIILPGVLGLNVKPYHPLLYIPLGTMILSLILRLLSDTMVLPYIVRQWSGWVSAGSILLYFMLLLRITVIKLRYAKAV